MKIITKLNLNSDNDLESYRPQSSNNWHHVLSGYWSDDRYHSGYIEYYIHQTDNSTWVMEGVQRNAMLDGLTQEDIDEGNLDDDQIQALLGTTLKEAQSAKYSEIVAVMLEAPSDIPTEKAADLMYNELIDAGGKVIEEVEDYGLIAE